jgi:hypothetical protein
MLSSIPSGKIADPMTTVPKLINIRNLQPFVDRQMKTETMEWCIYMPSW